MEQVDEHGLTGTGTDEVGEEATAQEPAADARPWTVGSWNGLPQHLCRLCPFDTLEGEAVIRAHYRERHGSPPPEPPRRVVSQILDRWGEPIVKIVEE